MEFTKFLEKSRKPNGEQYLPKTIILYNEFIERYKSHFQGTIDETIEEMNKIISQYSHANLRAAFRMYLLYIGVDEEDAKLKNLKSSKRRASAMNSLRMLGDKVIAKKDLKLFYSQLEPEWQMIVGFLYDTGCREDEMLQTKWKNIEILNPPKPEIFASIEVVGKGKKKRIVYLSESTLNLIKSLRPNIRPDDKIFVFRMENGKEYKRQEKALIDGFEKRTEKFLGKKYSPHAMRHTKLSHLANNGADVLGISSYAGHSDLKVTQIYIKHSSQISENTYKKFSEDIND